MPRKGKGTALWWAVGGVAVVGLYVYLKGRSVAPATSGPSGQVPTAIGPALNVPGGSSSSGDPGPTPSGDTGTGDSSTDAYQPGPASTGLNGGTYGGYGAPYYASLNATQAQALFPTALPGTVQGYQGTVVPGFTGNPGAVPGGLNPGGAMK